MANAPASYVTYAGKYAMKDGGASFFLEPGPDPSTGWITLHDNDAQSLGHSCDGFDLVFFHEGATKTYKHIYWTSIEDAGPGISRVVLVDSRILWKRRYITGIFNQVELKTIDTDMSTRVTNATFHTDTNFGKAETKGWTVKELAQKLADKLAESEKGIWKPTVVMSKKIASVDKESNPVLRNVHWECVPAGEALQAILNLVGGHVSIDLEGSIVITIPEDDFVSSIRGAIDNAWVSRSGSGTRAIVDKPDAIRFKWRILREKKFKKSYWTPLLQHDGKDVKGKLFTDQEKPRPGDWLDAEDVLKDWGMELKFIKKNWGILKETAKDDKIKQSRYDAILRDLYRTFRWTQPTTTSTETYRKILPFHESRGTVGDWSDGSPIYAAPYVVDGKTFTQIKAGDGAQLVECDIPSGAVRIDDFDTGIITFQTSTPVCKFTKNGPLIQDIELGDHDFAVVVAWQKKFIDDEDLGADYYSYEVKDKWSGVQGNLQTDEVLDTSQYYIERDLDASGTFSTVNEPELEAYADLYAEDRFKQIGKLFDAQPEDIETRTYIPGANRLDGKLLHIETGWDPSSGPFERFRIASEAPLNPFASNFMRSHDSLRTTGETIDTSSRGRKRLWGYPGHIPEIGDRAVGLLGHCADLGNRSFRDLYQIPLTWINQQNYGLVCAEDLPFSEDEGKGETPTDHRTQHARIKEVKDGRAEYDRVKKYDETYAFGREVWEAVLVSEPVKKSGSSDEEAPTAAGPVITTGGTGSNANSGSAAAAGAQREGCSGGGLTQASPATPTTPTKTTAKKGGTNKSTFVFTDSPEGKDGNKGALNNVLMVAKHRSYGEDEDGNTINRLEIDKERAYHHREIGRDILCGPLLDDGRGKRPNPRGYNMYAAQIFDKREDGWVYYAKFDGGGIPGPPPGTPGPGPNPPPPIPPVITGDPGGGGGGNPPGGGGGGDPVGDPGQQGPPGSEPGGGGVRIVPGPVITPSGAGVPVDRGARVFIPGHGWQDIPPSGPPPIDIPGIPGGGPNSGPNIGGTGYGTSGHGIENGGGFPSPPVDTPIGKGGVDLDDLHRRAMGQARRGRMGWGVPTSNFCPLPREIPMADITPINDTMAYHTLAYTRESPYLGTSFTVSALNRPPVGGSPYCPGGVSWTRAQELAFQMPAVPSSWTWGGAAIAANQISNADYMDSTLTGLIKSAAEAANNALGRIDTLDARCRADYNTAETATIPNGTATVDFTTALPYTAQPCLTITPYGAVGAISIGAVVANADNTYTFTINSESNAVGDVALDVDVKGSVADGTDIDP